MSRRRRAPTAHRLRLALVGASCAGSGAAGLLAALGVWHSPTAHPVAAITATAAAAAMLISAAASLAVERWVAAPEADLRALLTGAGPACDPGLTSARLSAVVDIVAGQLAPRLPPSSDILVGHLRTILRILPTAIDTGVAELSAAVAASAVTIAGPGSAAVVAGPDASGAVTPVAQCGPVPVAVLTACADRPPPAQIDGWPLVVLELTRRVRLAVAVPPQTSLDGATGHALGLLASTAGSMLERAALLGAERHALAHLRALESEQLRWLSVGRHELRSPLAIISGVAELAQTSWAGLNDEQRAHALVDVGACVSQLAATIEVVLEQIALCTERVEPATGPVDLLAAVRRAAAAVEGRIGAAGRRRFDLPGGDPVAITADARRLQLALEALLEVAAARSECPVQVTLQLAGPTAALRITGAGEGPPLPPRLELGLAMAARVCALQHASLHSDAEGALLGWPRASPGPDQPRSQSGAPEPLSL